MRQLKYDIACSVDHYIARQDGSLNCFLMEGEHMIDLRISGTYHNGRDLH
jgi:hypothetical protein